MGMKRGDIITVVISGDYGKPRPALVVQSDLFSEHPSVTVLPITSHIRETPLFRFDIEPSLKTGLHKKSQVMIDKSLTVPKEKVGQVIGRLNQQKITEINRLLAIFLGVI
ncbi:PemK-like protein [methanotrophic bacterial endosymbiont of Bathymodiolus sp.]|nr:PemK-like protein [methanotrophic bacterial endosymbiont of Bathymodiolus sp.]